MMFRSLSFRLTVYACILTYALLLSCWGLIYLAVDRELYNKDQETVSDRLATIESLLNLEPKNPVRLIRRVEDEWPKKSFERIYVRITDRDGKLITETPSLKTKFEQMLEKFPTQAQLIGRINPLVSTEIQDRKFDMGSFFIPVGSLYKNEKVLVQVALERTGEEILLATLRRALIYLLAFGFIGSLLSSRLTVSKVLTSVKNISMTAQKVSTKGLHERINTDELPIEFIDFAQTLNSMLDRLKESFERLSRFSADMAHELRTPLNNLMGSMEVALAKERSQEEYETLLASGMEECSRLKRIIDSLLFIARAQQPANDLQKHPVDLVEELQAIISFYEVSAEKRNIKLVFDVREQVQIQAERTLLQRAVGNLLSNAIRLAPEGSIIEVGLKKENDRVSILVKDSGPGIPEELIPFVGERFFRVEASRSHSSGGTGLGLSIVKSIVEAHGGQIKVESEVGVGSSFYLFLPV
ncbi:MAG TPA: heavy metal sensor histidine kinase [Bdellovibrio sp.]|nr:heavy metal sensor histidine kinase [Bdellovibrio sp.]